MPTKRWVSSSNPCILGSIVSCRSQKILVWLNSAMLQCYDAAIAIIWQYFVINRTSQNNCSLLKFCYAMALLFQNIEYLSCLILELVLNTIVVAFFCICFSSVMGNLECCRLSWCAHIARNMMKLKSRILTMVDLKVLRRYSVPNRVLLLIICSWSVIGWLLVHCVEWSWISFTSA
jgi:hypothetical protein